MEQNGSGQDGGPATALAEQSLGELVKSLSEQTSKLVRDEMRLAVAELKDKGKRAGIGAGMFGVAAVLALYGGGAMIAFLIAVLAEGMDVVDLNEGPFPAEGALVRGAHGTARESSRCLLQASSKYASRTRHTNPGHAQERMRRGVRDRSRLIDGSRRSTTRSDIDAGSALGSSVLTNDIARSPLGTGGIQTAAHPRS